MNNQEKPYNQLVSDLLKSIGDEGRRLFSYPDCELDCSFIGFLESYADLKDVPKDFTVIDIGCCQAFQGDYYKEHKQYIGVDIAVPIEQRLRQDNAEYYDGSGQDFIEKTLPELIDKGLDLNKTIAICSYVPDEKLQQMVADTFPYHRVIYCDDMISEKLPAFEKAKEHKQKKNDDYER